MFKANALTNLLVILQKDFDTYKNNANGALEAYLEHESLNTGRGSTEVDIVEYKIKLQNLLRELYVNNSNT